MINNEADEIMNIYGEKCSKIHIPNPEQEFQQKCSSEKETIMEKYFSRKPSNTAQPSQVGSPQQTAQPQQQQLLTEKQQRNGLLNEAAVNMAKVLPFFETKEARDYIKEIREAIEELMD
jgi:hypothetical protein